ncbi:MAG: hypothetical protein AB7S48_13560 [Bacteroidales bacterium]
MNYLRVLLRVLISMLILLLIVGVLTLKSQTKSTGGVFVLGGIHQSHEKAKVYTYERMGEIYKELKPDILLVETLSKSASDKSFKGTPYDFVKFMIPLALKDSIPIYGIDWWDKEKGEKWRTLQKDLFRDSAFIAEVKLFGAMFAMLNGYFIEKDFAEINSEYITEIWKAKSEFKYSVMRQNLSYSFIADYEKERNDSIVANIIDIVRRYSGKKILVAIGIDHKYYIEDKLRELNIKVYRTDEIEEFKKL